MSSDRREGRAKSPEKPRMQRRDTKLAPPFAPLAWSADPLFRGHEAALAALADLDDWPSAPEIDERLGPLVERALGFRVRFRTQVREEPLRYEATIVTKHEVPTRDGSPHDLLNALAWATFPRAKLALHTRFHEAEAARTVPGRTRFQDRLTLLDEGAALREEGGAQAWLFGHAILEHRVASHAGARAELFELAPLSPGEGMAAVDAAFASALAAFPDPAPLRPAGVAIPVLFPEAQP